MWCSDELYTCGLDYYLIMMALCRTCVWLMDYEIVGLYGYMIVHKAFQSKLVCLEQISSLALFQMFYANILILSTSVY